MPECGPCHSGGGFSIFFFFLVSGGFWIHRRLLLLLPYNDFTCPPALHAQPAISNSILGHPPTFHSSIFCPSSSASSNLPILSKEPMMGGGFFGDHHPFSHPLPRTYLPASSRPAYGDFWPGRSESDPFATPLGHGAMPFLNLATGLPTHDRASQFNNRTPRDQPASGKRGETKNHGRVITIPVQDGTLPTPDPASPVNSKSGKGQEPLVDDFVPAGDKSSARSSSQSDPADDGARHHSPKRPRHDEGSFPAWRANRMKLDEAAAAIKIQSCYRGFAVRRYKPLLHLRAIAKVSDQLGELQSEMQKPDFGTKVRKDYKERLRFTEGIMALLLQLDAIQGALPEVRNLRKAATRKAIQLQEAVDAMLLEMPNSCREPQTVGDLEFEKSCQMEGQPHPTVNGPDFTEPFSHLETDSVANDHDRVMNNETTLPMSRLDAPEAGEDARYLDEMEGHMNLDEALATLTDEVKTLGLQESVQSPNVDAVFEDNTSIHCVSSSNGNEIQKNLDDTTAKFVISKEDSRLEMADVEKPCFRTDVGSLEPNSLLSEPEKLLIHHAHEDVNMTFADNDENTGVTSANLKDQVELDTERKGQCSEGSEKSSSLVRGVHCCYKQGCGDSGGSDVPMPSAQGPEHEFIHSLACPDGNAASKLDAQDVCDPARDNGCHSDLFNDPLKQGESRGVNTRLLERLSEDNRKLKKVVAELYKQNQVQSNLISVLNKKIENIEKQATRRKQMKNRKKRNARQANEGRITLVQRGNVGANNNLAYSEEQGLHPSPPADSPKAFTHSSDWF